MDQTTQILLLIITAALGLIATILILRRDRLRSASADRESPFAVATEGMKRCPACGVANLVTDATCSACGETLPG
ncbi:MAG TPA: hypothetical protein VFI69_00380 [Candidatus Limnocylindrales bacterium]|jgi:hypothetical protein|nr:hypothetical protein [Candidatus Limnocylindrales bacterium]